MQKPQNTVGKTQNRKWVGFQNSARGLCKNVCPKNIETDKQQYEWTSLNGPHERVIAPRTSCPKHVYWFISLGLINEISDWPYTKRCEVYSQATNSPFSKYVPGYLFYGNSFSNNISPSVTPRNALCENIEIPLKPLWVWLMCKNTPQMGNLANSP